MTPLLVRVDNLATQTSSQYAFARSPVRIGRNALNDLALEFPFVSQWHAVVQFDDQNTQYFDLGSTNGTLVNGQRVGKNVPVPLGPNLEFRLGALRVYFARGPAPPHLLNQQKGQFGGAGFGVSQVGAAPAMPSGGGGEATMMFDVGSSAYDPKGPTAQAMGNLAQVRAASEQVWPLYQAYRASWTTLFKALNESLARVGPEAYKTALSHIEREMPLLGNEEEFRALAQAQQVALSGPAGASFAAGTLIGQMAQYFVPGASPPANPGDVERMLVRMAAVLDAFSTSFVALRKGYNQFGSEMALPHNRGAGDPTPLNSATDPRQVLHYILDWTADAQIRVSELTSAYADIMIHQVALLNGLMEGVRSLLYRLGPAEIAREVAQNASRSGPFGFFKKIWPFRSSALWQRYAQRHRELTEEDREITSAVFGNEFARAYAGVVGENFTESGPKRLNDGRR